MLYIQEEEPEKVGVKLELFLALQLGHFYLMLYPHSSVVYIYLFFILVIAPCYVFHKVIAGVQLSMDPDIIYKWSRGDSEKQFVYCFKEYSPKAWIIPKKLKN